MKKALFFLVACSTFGRLQGDVAPTRSLFSYSQKLPLASQVRCLHDMVLFNNGELVKGTLGVLPKLQYTFADIDLDVDDVLVISKDPQNSDKFRIVTRNGDVYYSRIDKREFPFLEWVDGNSRHVLLSMEDVATIFLRPREKASSDIAEASYYMSFADGSMMPVSILDQEIVLTSRYGEKKLPTAALLDVSFSGGLFGKVLDEKGRQVDLPLTFTKSPYLSITLPRNGQMMKLPWEKVDSLHKKGVVNDSQQVLSRVPVYRSSIGTPRRVDEEVLAKVVEAKKPPAGLKLVVSESRSKLDKSQPVKAPVLALHGLDPDKIDYDRLIAFGEDFEIDSIEESPTVEFQNEEIEFVSVQHGRAEKNPILVAKVYEIEENEIAMNDTLVTALPQERSDLLEDTPYEVTHNNEIVEEDNVQVFVEESQDTSDSKHCRMISIPKSDSGTYSYDILPKKVTNQQYQQFVNAVGYKVPSHWNQGRFPPGLADQPVVNVTYRDAYLYAVWSGGRLPTSNELSYAVDKLEDRDDTLVEWTSTPASAKSQVAHVIFGAEAGEVMSNNDRNNHTGFRVVASAQDRKVKR